MNGYAFTFARATCAVCPLLARCGRSKTAGRTVRTTAYEDYLQAARQRQHTPEFQERYRLRSAVERLLAALVQHGLRGTRYLGEAKRHLPRLWTAAAVNLLRLFKLAQSKAVDLTAVLGGRKLAQPAVATG